MSQHQLPPWLGSVHHDGSELYVSNLYPALRDPVNIRLRLSTAAPVKKIYLRIYPDGEQAFVSMELASTDSRVQWWQTELSIDQPLVHYRFLLLADDGVWFYSAAGPSANEPLDATDFRILADYKAPVWLSEAVFYQIFPDRFANGDPSNDPRPKEFEYRGYHPQTYDWDSLPPDEQNFSLVFYGGDLQGIIQKLDYLESLGVNALYLNPVFTAYSNHKYDVVDYEHVDSHFGGDEELAALREALDDRDMHYILDIVPNHCGYWHPWFQRARQDINAPEAEFFTFEDHPDGYASWLGVWILPKLNYRSNELRNRIYAGQGAVFRRWLRPPFSADGWRVDVANMLGRQGTTQMGEEVSRGIRQAVKETQPKAYLMGENFFDPSSQLQGDQWDAVMNYTGLIIPLLRWLRGYQQGAFGMQEKITSPIPLSTSALEASWREHRAAIPWAITLQQYNLLGSHDVPRIRTELEGNQALHKLAAIIQFTYPGVPGIYYGDEIGMSDIEGLASRAPMIWEPSEWDHDMLAFYQKLIALRRRSTILQRGGFQMLAVEADLFAYQRESIDGRILVVAQRSVNPRPAGALPIAHAGIPDETRFVEYFTGEEATVASGALHLPEHYQGATLWREKEY
jgi:alpha-glucosidase